MAKPVPGQKTKPTTTATTASATRPTRPEPTPQVLTALWSSLMASNLIIAGVGVMLAAQRGELPPFDAARLFPTNFAEPAGFIFCFAFVSAAAALALPGMLRQATTTEAAASPVARAMAPFLFQMALAESATLMGLMSAVILPASPVVERLVIPLGLALAVSARAFPSAARIAALAGPGAPGQR